MRSRRSAISSAPTTNCRGTPVIQGTVVQGCCEVVYIRSRYFESTNVDNNGLHQHRKIGPPGYSVLEPLGCRQRWGTATVARIRQEIPEDVGQLTLRQQDIDEVLTCGGLWQGREIAT